MIEGIFSLRNFYDSAINALFELRNLKKTGSSLKTRIVMHYSNGQAETLYGYTDPSDLLLFAPLKLKAWLRPKVYYVDGVKTCYVSANSGTVLDMQVMEKVSNAVVSSGIVSWRHMRTFVEMKVSEMHTTFDMGLIDAEGTYLGTDYATMTHSVTSTSVMDFLKDKSNKVYLLSCLATALLGSVITGFLLSAIWMLILLIVISIVT